MSGLLPHSPPTNGLRWSSHPTPDVEMENRLSPRPRSEGRSEIALRHLESPGRIGTAASRYAAKALTAITRSQVLAAGGDQRATDSTGDLTSRREPGTKIKTRTDQLMEPLPHDMAPVAAIGGARRMSRIA
jgi:hypothetical protein